MGSEIGQGYPGDEDTARTRFATLDQANAVIHPYLPRFNQRFTQPPAESAATTWLREPAEVGALFEALADAAPR